MKKNLAEQHVLLSICFGVISDIFAKFNSPSEKHRIFIYSLQMNNWLSQYGDIWGHHSDKIYFRRIKRFPFEVQKDNVLYFSNVFSHSMVIKYSSLSFIFLFQNLLFWSFFQGDIKTVFRCPFWLQLYSLYSCWLLLIYAPVQRALQRNLPSCQFLWIFQTKPLKSFFC